MNKLYENLMKAYYQKGKIGNVKPFNYEHAKKIAYATACAILNRRKANV